MLTNSQEIAYKRIMDWYKNKTSPIFRLGGPAGSGKSYLIRMIAESVGLTSCKLMTPTGKASNNLIKAGLSSHTIHSQIYRVKSQEVEKEPETEDGNPLENLLAALKNSEQNNSTYDTESAEFVLKDPSAFYGTPLFIIDEGSMVGQRLLNDILSFNVPVLLVGDPNQLPPVNDNSVYKTCDYYLNEIVRQASGSPVIWLSQQVLTGNLTLGNFGTSQVRKTPATDDELKFADEVLTDTNISRSDLNSRIRKLTMDLRSLNSQFSVGDKIICRTNTDIASSEGFVLTNGAQGKIQKIKHTMHKGQLIDVVMETDELGDFSFIGTSVPEKFPSRLRPPKIEYGYALTVHLSQGSEWNNVIYRVTGRLSKSALYTAVTRAKNSVLVILEN